MGRLDDAAKRKVVELRKAGLSFRKIKAVLELENIKVSAQAIYLFLKEFQGKSRPEGALAGHAGATQSTTGVVSAREVGIGEGRRGGWSDQQLRSLLREASRVAGYSDPTDSSQQSGPISEARGQPSGAGGSIDRGRDEQQDGGKEDDIRIISVTSLAQGSQQGVVHPSRSGVGSGPVTGAFIRRRYTPSPASNPVLVARKRLLDKALLHKARMRDSGPQTGQQMASLMRREQADFSESDGRKVMLSQTPSYDLTTSRAPQVRGLHQGAGPPRRPFQQRVGVPVRSLPQLPRMRLPTAGPTSAAPQGSSPTIRVQAPANQPSPTSQQSGSEAGMRNTLQEQFHSLSSEIRSLGLALRMMVEQQTRLEREQAQQTQIQKQILNTLQGLASKLGTSSLHHTTAPTPPASCSLSAVSFSQSTLTPSHGTYTQCSQAHSRYSEMEGPSLESMEAFSLDGLSSSAMNGFQPCSTSDGLSFTHTQTNTPAYTQSHTQPFSPVGSHSTSYTQSHSQTYAGVDSKTEEMPSTSAEGSLQDCNASSHSSSHPVSPITLSPHGPQLNIIKIESV